MNYCYCWQPFFCQEIKYHTMYCFASTLFHCIIFYTVLIFPHLLYCYLFSFLFVSMDALFQWGNFLSVLLYLRSWIVLIFLLLWLTTWMTKNFIIFAIVSIINTNPIHLLFFIFHRFYLNKRINPLAELTVKIIPTDLYWWLLLSPVNNVGIIVVHFWVQ